MHRIPQDAMINQVVAVDEVISCAGDVLSGNIIPALLQFVWESPYAFTDDLDASLQCGRRLPICQKGIKCVRGTQGPGLFSGVANLCERDSRVTTAHESS